MKAQRLFQLRRAAGTVLAKLETQALSDEKAARAKFLEITARATGIPMTEGEGARWRVETDDFLRSATRLQALLGAEEWRVKLGEGWWTRPLTPTLSPPSQGEGAR
jgi:hypothetical protein